MEETNASAKKLAEDANALELAQRVRGHMVRFVDEEGRVVWVNAFLVQSVEDVERSLLKVTHSTTPRCHITTWTNHVVEGTPDQAAALLMQARFTVSDPGKTLANAMGGLGAALLGIGLSDRKPSDPSKAAKPPAPPAKGKKFSRVSKRGNRP